MTYITIECSVIIEEIDFTDKAIRKILECSKFPFAVKFYFALHEVLGNSFESMVKKYGLSNKHKIMIRLEIGETYAKASVTDIAGGIPEEIWDELESTSFEDVLHKERGRGILFIKSIVSNFAFNVEKNGEATYYLEMVGDNNGES